MEKKVAIVLLLWLMVQAMAMGNGEGLRDVEEWFQKLGHAKEKVTRLHFYFHDTLKGKNPTAMVFAQPKNFTSYFGHMVITDDPLTIGPDLTSKEVGRAQGFYGAVDQKEVSLAVAMNLVFTDGENNGSTLAVLGHNPVLQANHRELPIIGGSGFFRLARGTAVLGTHSFDLATGNAIVEYHAMVIHY